MVLALALLGAVIGVCVGIVATVMSGLEAPPLGENTTQVLTGLIGGVVGLLGGYLGHRDKNE